MQTSTTTQVLYDVSQEPPQTRGDVRGGIAGSILGVLMLLVVWGRRERAPRVFAVLWIAVWAGVSAYNVTVIRRNHREAVARLAGGEVSVVEGAVEDLRPVALDGKGYETFKVGGKVFVLGQDAKAAGLWRTSTQGGPVREGLRLRVTFRDKSILKVESLDPSGK